MRTTRFFGWRVVWSGGGGLWSREGVGFMALPIPCEQTNTCKYITFLQLRLRMVKKDQGINIKEKFRFLLVGMSL